MSLAAEALGTHHGCPEGWKGTLANRLDHCPELLVITEVMWLWLGDMVKDGWVGKDLVVGGAKDVGGSRMVFIPSPENCRG